MSDESTCALCGRWTFDDEELCNRCYDEEHGPDEKRFASGDFATPWEWLEYMDQYGGKLWR